MTKNKAAKLAAVEALGFQRCGMKGWWDKHEKVACRVCGYATPFYRLDLAEKHRQGCSVWQSQWGRQLQQALHAGARCPIGPAPRHIATDLPLLASWWDGQQDTLMWAAQNRCTAYDREWLDSQP